MSLYLKSAALLAVGSCAYNAAPSPAQAEHKSVEKDVVVLPTEPATPKGPRVPVVDCAPVEKVGYRGGRAFPITVLSIDGRLVESATARAYWAMQQAAAAEGIELPIYSGFRSHEDQAYFRRCFKTCSCNSCSPAARPGHSKHQSGSAIDFGQWLGAISWLENHGREYRFFATVPREPWHWEYRPRHNKRKRKQWPPICHSTVSDQAELQEVSTRQRVDQN